MTTPEPGDLLWSDYRALVEQVEDYAIFVLDLQGYVATWNRGAQKIKGYAADEIVGQHFSKFYPAEDIAANKPQRKLEAALATGHVEDEGWRIRRDGSRFWAFVSITLLRDANGQPRGFGKLTRDLTERRDAEEQLRLSEERFRSLIDGVSDYAIYMLDPRGIVTTWNSGAEKIKGYTRQQIIGRDFAVFFSPEDQQAGRPQAELDIAVREGRFEEEGRRVRADCSEFWASVVVTALRDPAGRLLGFSKVTRDLTARKAAEEIARELERQHTARIVAEAGEARLSVERERYRSLSQQLDVILEGVADGITVQDRTGKLLFANSAAARQIGLSTREELLSIPAAELLSRFELLDEHGHIFPLENLPGRRVLAGEKVASSLLRVRARVSGDEWWSNIRSTAVLSPNGLAEMAINIWHDVSHERRLEAHQRYLDQTSSALSASLDYRTNLQAVAELLVPGLCDWCTIHVLEGDTLQHVALMHADPRKRLKASESLANYSLDPQAPGGLWQVVRSGEPVLQSQVPDAALRGDAVDEQYFQLLQQTGMRSLILAPIKVRDQVSGVLSLIATESGRRYDDEDVELASELGRRIGTFIENAKLYERAQQAAERAQASMHEAEAAGRLKDEFLATVSHELRTPLNAMLGWSALLKTRNDAQSLERGIGVIHRNALAQGKIIEDILDVSRIVTGKLHLELTPVDLVSLAGDAIEVVRPSAAAQDIQIEFALPAEPAVMVGDAERLRQVMWNLLSNAVKFSKMGGSVRLRLEQTGAQVRLSVSDDGKGIDAEFLPHVFDRFKQEDGSTTRRYGGLGLGLAIVRHIVELHGGRVSAASEGPDRGATFEIVFPVRAAAPVAVFPTERPSRVRAERTPAAPTPLAGVRVLIVDDEQDARELLQMLLSEVGAEVHASASAAEGYLAVARFLPHVIVSDVGMPGEDGYSFMKRLRASDQDGANTPAIALTAYTRKQDKQQALAMGFDAHLAKPVDTGDLTQAIFELALKATVKREASNV